jgi:hypothetical protein
MLLPPTRKKSQIVKYEFENSQFWEMACANCYFTYEKPEIGQIVVTFPRF